MFEHEFERDFSKAINIQRNIVCWTHSRFVLVTEHKLTAFSNGKKRMLVCTYVRCCPLWAVCTNGRSAMTWAWVSAGASACTICIRMCYFWGQITNISAHDRHLIIPSALWFRRVLAAHNAYYCCDAASVIVPTPMQKLHAYVQQSTDDRSSRGKKPIS